MEILRLLMPKLFFSLGDEGAGEGGAGAGAEGGEGAGEGGEGGAGEGGSGAGEGGNEFKLPDEYKEKPWAKEIKSVDDLLKQHDGVQELIGKKSLPPKLEEMTDVQREEYYKGSRPEKWEDYEFPESFTDFEKESTAKVFHKYGVSAFKGKALALELEAENKRLKDETYGEKPWQEILKNSFGAEFEKKGGEITGFIMKNATEGDQAFLKAAPNEVLGAFYRTINNVLGSYGITDTGKGGGKPGNAGGIDMDKQRAEIRQQIVDLSKKPHTAEEKKNLIDKLKNSYK